MEKLKRAETDDERVHWITQGKLTYEVVTGVIKPTKAVWEAILYQMPTFALLRHLNTLDRAGVLEGAHDYIVKRLTDSIALQKAMILPFRFVKAFHQVSDPVIQDISGSMQGEFLEIGSVFAFALYKKTRGNGLFWLFDTEVTDAKPSIHDSILTQAAKIKARGGTDTGSRFYTDLAQYRKTVNRDVKAFIIDIAPYRNAMVPPLDPNTFYVYGWSDTVLQYIANTTQGFMGMVEKIRNADWS